MENELPRAKLIADEMQAYKELLQNDYDRVRNQPILDIEGELRAAKFSLLR